MPHTIDIAEIGDAAVYRGFTSGASIATIATIPVLDNEWVQYHFWIVSQQQLTSGAPGSSWYYVVTVRQSEGNAEIVGSTKLVEHNNSASVVTIDISTTNLRIRAEHPDGDDFDWCIRSNKFRVHSGA